MASYQNPKFEIRNPKQIPITKIQMTKTRFEFRKLEFRYCFEFRASNFEFPLL